ncbi:hypothetical protein [Faecalibacterium prausnitzii]|uniref:hypothetical protein n=1 Tax=Faecalibacterium TaxID=216851 RepID=UPI0032ECB227
MNYDLPEKVNGARIGTGILQIIQKILNFIFLPGIFPLIIWNGILTIQKGFHGFNCIVFAGP